MGMDVMGCDASTERGTIFVIMFGGGDLWQNTAGMLLPIFVRIAKVGERMTDAA